MEKNALHISRKRAVQLKSLRSIVLHKLFIGRKQPRGEDAPILNDIANSFSRFAAFQQTAFDNGASLSSGGSEAASIERQVERAFIQVLGRGTGRGPGNFINLLNSTFPAVPTGEGKQVVFTPVRGVVSLSPSDGYGTGVSTQAGKQADF